MPISFVYEDKDNNVKLLVETCEHLAVAATLQLSTEFQSKDLQETSKFEWMPDNIKIEKIISAPI